MPMQNDHDWMQLALAEAVKGEYTARPNPCVGCVLVKEGELIGKGFHPQTGQPHAEVFALREAGEQAIGATAYVTLEPCAHTGRTPPCALALIDAQVQRVVMATLDSNPQVAGQGKALLEAAGVLVTVGVCEEEARAQNAGFLRVMAGGLPYVRLKLASSLDGRVAMASGESKWITSELARLDVQHWRAKSGAIVTGIGTVLADDPQLNVRPEASWPALKQQVPPPIRVVMDRGQRMPADAKMLKLSGDVIVCGPAAPKGAVAWQVDSLAHLLARLASERMVRDVLIESGVTLASAFLQANLVDELILYVSPQFLGADALPVFDGRFAHLADTFKLELLETVMVGSDIRMRLKPRAAKTNMDE